jgi:hypothetical protein
MAGNLDFFDKFPGEKIEYDADASSFVAGNDSIASVSAEVITGDVEVSGARVSGTTVYFTVQGGAGGTVANVLVTANLTSGQIRQGLATILIKRLPAS